MNENSYHNIHLLLCDGPIGKGVLKDSILVELDGQNISLNKKLLIINDERSPYHGMSAADYYSKIVKPWVKANKKLKEKTEIEKEKMMEINSEWKFLFVITVPPYEYRLIPSWPEGIINHLKEKYRKISNYYITFNFIKEVSGSLKVRKKTKKINLIFYVPKSIILEQKQYKQEKSLGKGVGYTRNRIELLLPKWYCKKVLKFYK